MTVAGRRGFERLYDLPERVLPSAVINHPELSEADAQRGLLLHAAKALGLGTEKDIRDYFRQDPAPSRLALKVEPTMPTAARASISAAKRVCRPLRSA